MAFHWPVIYRTRFVPSVPHWVFPPNHDVPLTYPEFIIYPPQKKTYAKMRTYIYIYASTFLCITNIYHSFPSTTQLRAFTMMMRSEKENQACLGSRIPASNSYTQQRNFPIVRCQVTYKLFQRRGVGLTVDHSALHSSYDNHTTDSPWLRLGVVDAALLNPCT